MIEDASKVSSEMIATKIGRLAFGSVQLICGDFLTSIPDDSILMLLDLLYLFCDQKEDLNMSLTVCKHLSLARSTTEKLDNHVLLERLGLPTWPRGCCQDGGACHQVCLC